MTRFPPFTRLVGVSDISVFLFYMIPLSLPSVVVLPHFYPLYSVGQILPIYLSVASHEWRK
jgi:hypothetical protein